METNGSNDSPETGPTEALVKVPIPAKKKTSTDIP
jgi:hypothetical protein